MKKFVTAIAIAGGLCQTTVYAARETPFDFGPGYLTFYQDNDLFGNRDQDYTNGARLAWISGARKMNDIGAIQRALRPFTGDEDSLDTFQRITGFKDPDKIQYNYGFSLTQLMYTPEDFSSLTQPEGERRYAGWAALGFSLHTKDEKLLNSVEFMLGITGKYSYAQDTQDFIHDLRDIDKFLGWDDQIPTEVTVDLSFVQKRRFQLAAITDSLSVDGYGEWGTRLGTFRTTAHVGGLVRIGFHLSTDFSDPRLSENAYVNKYFTGDEAEVSNWSLFLLSGFKATAVAYDATLDGPLFHDFETGNTREPFVGEIYAGFGFRFHSVEISYAHTWRTEEYKEQKTDSNFGTVSIRLQF